MREIQTELTIAHRVCPALSRTAIGFATKLEMVTACARSMATALQGLNAHIHLILDGCSADYEDRLRAVFSSFDLIVEKTDAIGNLPTWARQIDILKAAKTEIVYFSEDDYLYAPEAFRAMLEVVGEKGVDFVTPLDHPDRYDSRMEEYHETPIFPMPLRHWRKVANTCLTFMTTKDVLLATERILRTYSRGVVDSSMWLGLTKDSVFSPVALFRAGCALVPRLLHLPVHSGRYQPVFAWKDHGLRLLVTRRFGLWSPLPELARHLSSDCVPVTKVVGRTAAQIVGYDTH